MRTNKQTNKQQCFPSTSRRWRSRVTADWTETRSKVCSATQRPCKNDSSVIGVCARVLKEQDMTSQNACSWLEQKHYSLILQVWTEKEHPDVAIGDWLTSLTEKQLNEPERNQHVQTQKSGGILHSYCPKRDSLYSKKVHVNKICLLHRLLTNFRPQKDWSLQSKMFLNESSVGTSW